MNSTLQQIQSLSSSIQNLAQNVDTQLNTQDQTILSLQGNVATEQNKLDEAQKTVAAQAALITSLQKRVTVVGIQAMVPETLWYEARSAGAPKAGPHGTVAITPGSPAVCLFHPALLPNNQSDNCYNLQRLYPKLTAEQKAALETCSGFEITCDVALDPLANVQAFELDYQTKKSTGVVINVGLQILPTGTVRAFDFVKKDWQPVGAKVNLASGAVAHIGVEATCDDKVVQFVSVTTDQVKTPVTFSHPVSMGSTGSPYCNAAYQLDATATALPYKAIVDNLVIRFN